MMVINSRIWPSSSSSSCIGHLALLLHVRSEERRMTRGGCKGNDERMGFWSFRCIYYL